MQYFVYAQVAELLLVPPNSDLTCPYKRTCMFRMLGSLWNIYGGSNPRYYKSLSSLHK